MKCDCTCVNEAYCDCQWGPVHLKEDSPPITQQATLCKVHADQLWETINPLLQSNRAWYRIDIPGSITGKKVMITNDELIQTLQQRLKQAERPTETKPLFEEIPPCALVKDWGRKELIMFGTIVGVCTLLVVACQIWKF